MGFFSSRQITGMVIAACAGLALAPAAATASGALVTITDSATSAQARVSSVGHLQVDSASTDALERSPWASFNRAGNNAVDRIVLAGPTSRVVALSSLTASAVGGPVGVRIRVVEPTGTSCAAGNTVIVRNETMSFIVPAGESKSMSFPSPIIARPLPGKLTCIIAHADTTYVPASGAGLTVAANGYVR